MLSCHVLPLHSQCSRLFYGSFVWVCEYIWAHTRQCLWQLQFRNLYWWFPKCMPVTENCINGIDAEDVCHLMLWMYNELQLHFWLYIYLKQQNDFSCGFRIASFWQHAMKLSLIKLNNFESNLFNKNKNEWIESTITRILSATEIILTPMAIIQNNMLKIKRYIVHFFCYHPHSSNQLAST